MMTAEALSRKEGKKVLAWFIGFFGVMLAANAILVWIALESFSGVETEDAYHKGLEYNETIMLSHAQETEGVEANILFLQNEKQSGQLKISVKDANGLPFKAESVVVTCTRPTSSGHDFDVPMMMESDGNYAASVHFPMLGWWELRAYVKKDSNHAPYQYSRRITVQ